MAIHVSIEGMHCGGCVTSVRNALQRAGLPVLTVEVGHARLDVQPADEAVVQRARDAIAKAGFIAAAVTPEG
jgi:copper chaperone CopZ